MNWIQLNHIEQLNEIAQNDNLKANVIFKHSSSCGISSIALRRLEDALSDNHLSQFDFYFLDIFKHRDISDLIEERWKVQHESPQMLLIKAGKLVQAESHFAIEAEILDPYLLTR